MKAMLVMAESFKLMKVLVESLHVFVSITDLRRHVTLIQLTVYFHSLHVCL